MFLHLFSLNVQFIQVWGNTIPVPVWELLFYFQIDPNTDVHENCTSYSILVKLWSHMEWVSRVNKKSWSDIWSVQPTCVVTLYADLEALSECQKAAQQLPCLEYLTFVVL